MTSAAVTVDDIAATYSLSADAVRELERVAVAAKGRAYCRYSRFRVGAAVLATRDGDAAASGESSVEAVVHGANVENASFPVGICAERNAVGRAVTDGYTLVKAIAVSTDITPPASPCGMCRQFIREFTSSPAKVPIIMLDVHGNRVVMSLEELLPMSFGPDALPNVDAS